MDLQTQLEHAAERNWNKEKMELLERFDNERQEWECQWKVMQKKIEELYQEVKLRRESNMNAFENKAQKRPVHSPPTEWSATPGLNCCSLDKDSLLTRAEKDGKDMRNKRRNHVLVKDDLATENNKESEDCQGLKTTKNYTQDLNIALKELAKVSEELCSYQEEIRRKSNHRRKKLVPVLKESAESENTQITPKLNHVCNIDPPMASNAFETEEQNNKKNLMGINRNLKEMPSTALTGVEKTGILPWQKKEAPPVPPRSTSRHLTTSLSAVAQVSEALAKNTGSRSNCKMQECQKGNALINPPFSKPSDALLSTSKWQSVSGNAMATMVSIAKTEPSLECKLPVGFCHNTWSCDAGKNGNCIRYNASSHSVQKSCSDGNMVSPKQYHKLQSSMHYNNDLCAPVCDTLGDSGYGTGKTQRNETLEAKIDEFNRTVFHTDKGQKCFQEHQIPPSDPNPHHVLQDCKDTDTHKADVTCVSNLRFSSIKEEKACNPRKNVQAVQSQQKCPVGQQKQKQLNRLLTGYQHMLHEHDWKPSNLSGRPRSADSRSNYGVVEKLLKNYEKSTSSCTSKFHEEKWAPSDSEFTNGSCEALGHYFEMLQTDQGKQEHQKNFIRQTGLHAKQGKEKQKFPEVSLPAKQLTGKGFSRPARPANRRLPSRWATRSPSAPPALRRTTLN